MLVADIAECRAVDRIIAGDQVINEHANAIYVAARGCRFAFEDLRRHVNRRTGNFKQVSWSRLAAGAEVHQHDPAAWLAHPVSRFDVSVDEAGNVDGGKGTADTLPNQHRFARIKRASSTELRLERLPLNKPHAQPHTIAVRLDAEDADDIVVPDPGKRSSFGQQATV